MTVTRTSDGRYMVRLPVREELFRRSSLFQQRKRFQLTTVTYGTSCALYLATRVLNQLAEEIPSLPPSNKVINVVVSSEMAQLFDPLILVGSVMMSAKMFIKKLGDSHSLGRESSRESPKLVAAVPKRQG